MGKVKHLKVSICVVTLLAMVLSIAFTFRLAEAAEKQLLVGSIHSMSGPASRWGVTCTRGTQCAVDFCNKKGGLKIGGDVYRVKLLNYDSGGTADGAVTAVHRLIFEDSVKYVIGVNKRQCGTALQSIAEKEKVITLAPYLLYSEDMKLPNFYSFSIWPDSSDVYIAWFTWLRKTHPELKKIAILTKDDNYAKGTVSSIKNLLKKRFSDFKIVYEEYYPVETADFYPYLARLKNIDFDYLDQGSGEPRAAGLMLKQAYELGFKTPIFNMATNYGENIVKLAGAEACENFIFASPPVPGAPGATKLMEELNKVNIAKYGEPPDGLNTAWFEGGWAFLKGIQKANSLDTKKIAKTMGADDFRWEGLFGIARFRGKKVIGQNRSISYSYCIYDIHNGKTRLRASMPPPK